MFCLDKYKKNQFQYIDTFYGFSLFFVKLSFNLSLSHCFIFQLGVLTIQNKQIKQFELLNTKLFTLKIYCYWFKYQSQELQVQCQFRVILLFYF
ncbi:hypothetical protein pb186bvf_008892 [Paramecium bursaria]